MKKKGFTLIELLAVIIILAVIALIATPVVLNVVDNARKEANKNSAYGLLDAAKLYYAESLLDNSKYSNINGKINLIDEIKVSGKRPDSGYIYINDVGETAIAVVYDKVCYKKDFSESVLTETTEECSVSTSSESRSYILTGNLTVSDSTVEPIVVVFSDTPHYSTIDSTGKFEITDLEFGEHEFYLLIGLDLDDVKNMSKEEIISSAIINFTFNTNTITESQSFQIDEVNYEFSGCSVNEKVESNKQASYVLTGNLTFAGLTGEPVAVVFSDMLHYSTFKSNGFFSITNLESGEYQLYLLTGIDLDTIESMSKEEIISSAIVNFTFNTNSIDEPSMAWYINDTSIEFSNLYIIETTEYSKNLTLIDANGNGEADVGELITIGTERFYVISNNENNIEMLAKYNLLIGGRTENSENPGSFTGTEGVYTEDKNYGIQDSRALGCRVGSTLHEGVIRFEYPDNINWEIPYTTYEEYEEFEDTYVYNSSSLLYPYVENYVSYLKNMINESEGKISGALLSKKQAENLGCKDLTCTYAPSWVYSSTYWLGTGNFEFPMPEDKSSYRTYFIGADPTMRFDNETRNDFFYGKFIVDSTCIGVRPVITIDKTLLNN